jgi:hypothetical protein
MALQALYIIPFYGIIFFMSEELIPELPPTFYEAGFEDILAESLAAEESKLICDDNGTIVTSFESSQGNVIVRRPAREHESFDTNERFRNRIAALWIGKEFPGLERVVHFSLAENVVITKHGGLPLDHLPIEVMQQITADDWRKTLVAIEVATQAGIDFDLGSASNVVFRQNDGFTHIDFELADAARLNQIKNLNQTDITLRVLDIMLNENTYSYDEHERRAWQGVGKLALGAAIKNTPADELGKVTEFFRSADLG